MKCTTTTPTHKMLIRVLISLISLLIRTASPSAVFESEEFTLAIVNVSGVGAFTGFATNFRDEIPGHAFGKVASLTGILIRSISPVIDADAEEKDDQKMLDANYFDKSSAPPDQGLDYEDASQLLNQKMMKSSSEEGKLGGARVNYLNTKELIEMAKATKGIKNVPLETLLNPSIKQKNSSREAEEEGVDAKESRDGKQKMKYTNDACSPIKLDWIPPLQWILLVQYGNCPDEVKMGHISKTNASAVLVYDNLPGNRLVKFDPPGKYQKLGVSLLISVASGAGRNLVFEKDFLF